MSAKTVLITGSNRGIGLAFTKHFVANGWKVIAAARDPQSAIDVSRSDCFIHLHEQPLTLMFFFNNQLK